MTGAILVYCDGRPSLAVPVGWFWFKCSRCGQTFKGVGET